MGAVEADSRLHPGVYVRDHFLALRRGGSLPAVDVGLLVVVPLAGAVLGARRPISDLTGGAIFTVAGVFAGIMFQLTFQLLDRAGAWADSGSKRDPLGSNQAKRMRDLQAHACFAGAMSLLVALLALAAMLTAGRPSQALGGLMAFVLGHLAATLLLVLRRVYFFTENRLDVATGKTDEAEDESVPGP